MESPSSVISLLRQATFRSHQDIEDLLQLDHPGLSPERYRQAIAGFARFLPAWEAAVVAALPARLGPWFAKRSRLRFLARDVTALGLASAADGAPVHLPALSGVAAAYGSMYVLEGSALGGQVIARQVAARLGLDPDQGAAYFTGWRAGTGTLWREFRERLEVEVGPREVDRASACDAAVQTFAALEAVFRAVLPAPADAELEDEDAAAAALHGA